MRQHVICIYKQPVIYLIHYRSRIKSGPQLLLQKSKISLYKHRILTHRKTPCCDYAKQVCNFYCRISNIGRKINMSEHSPISLMVKYNIIPSYRRQIQYEVVRGILTEQLNSSGLLYIVMTNTIDINGQPFSKRFSAPYIHRADCQFFELQVYEAQVEVSTPHYYVKRILSLSKLNDIQANSYWSKIKHLSFDFA